MTGQSSEASKKKGPLKTFTVYAQQNHADWKQLQPSGGPPECSFDAGMWWCGWVTSQATTQEFPWQRLNTRAPNYGPPYDHTIWNRHVVRGYYMMAPSKGNGGKTAWLTSPGFTRSSQPCVLSFWYYMRGSGVSLLTLQGKNSTGTIVTTSRKMPFLITFPMPVSVIAPEHRALEHFSYVFCI
jgi:hypothetical protein